MAIKKVKPKKKKSPIKQEASFTGSITEHKDGSVFIFVDIQNKDGNTSKGLPLTKGEVKGIKKFVEFLDLG